MRILSVLPSVMPGLSIACLCAVAACSGSDTGVSSAAGDAAPDAPSTTPTNDASEDTSVPQDAGADVETETPTIATEVEPNNGTPATAIGTMVLPGTMNGKIDPANDVDLFSIALSPGDLWEWTATPTSADLAPHITVFDTAAGSLNPTVIGPGALGAPAKLQHFVLRPGTFVVGMRDSRNVGAVGNKGGPTYGYALVAKRGGVQPTAVTFPVTKTGKLASLGSIDLYTFTGTSGKGFDIVINAERKAVPSTLDSRLSLFDLTAKKAIITNDNAGGTTDSQIGSANAAPSTYMVIVENEGKDATDLSYEIEFKLR
jgi:hypothetical protein